MQTIQIPLVNIDHFTNNLSEKDRLSQKKKRNEELNKQFDVPTVNTNLIRCQIIIAVGPRITICVLTFRKQTAECQMGFIFQILRLLQSNLYLVFQKKYNVLHQVVLWLKRLVGILILFSRSKVKHLQPSHVFRLTTNQCSCYHVKLWFCFVTRHVPMSAKVFY